MPDNARKVAFFAGPILLAAAVEADDEEFAQALIDNGQPLTHALTAVEGKPLEFTLAGIARPKDFVLKPLFRLHDTPYAVYWDVLTEERWATAQKARAGQQELEVQSVDRVLIGDSASESAHQMKGDNTQSGNGAYGKHLRRKWRHAPSGGWFSYEVSVVPGRENRLCCTYWGRELGARKFEVLVDGNVVATESLDGNHTEAFYDAVYAVSAELVGDNAKVTVTFRPLEGNTAGGLFGLRVLK
jgi:hypothetical protein